MPSQPLPVFVNGAPLQAAPGTSLARLLADHDPDLLAALLEGAGQATDGRGIAVDPDDPVHAGAIYRVFRSSRRPESGDA